MPPVYFTSFGVLLLLFFKVFDRSTNVSYFPLKGICSDVTKSATSRNIFAGIKKNRQTLPIDATGTLPNVTSVALSDIQLSRIIGAGAD